MAELLVAIDMSKPVGDRLAPEVQAEVELLAPSNIPNGGVTTAKIATDAVTQDKLSDDSVGAEQIINGAVGAPELATGAVTTVKIANGAVTSAKAGAGVMRSKDASGNDVTITAVAVTAAQYAAIASPDPNTLYLIS